MILPSFFSPGVTKNGSVPWTKEQLKEVIKRHDENLDNLLSKAEVKKMFEELGSLFPGFRTWQAMRKADANGDGKIDHKEMEDLLSFLAGLNYHVKA